MCTRLKRKKTLIILAISSRIYVEAAVAAGFAVIAIDAFIDDDTRRLTSKSYRVDVEADQLNAQQVLNLLETLDLTEVLGLYYGAGFESQPDFLTELEKCLPVLGNPANVVKRCKAPDVFFSKCKLLNIPTPETRLTLPENPAGWLQKKVGGSGGGHITDASEAAKNDNIYYQQFQAGVSISCLFLANIEFVQIIGFNEQWIDENAMGDFCYGGSVNHAEIDANIKDKAFTYIQKICQQFELKGLNSCDFIYNQGDIYLLEVNPRLSASLDLYEKQQAILMQAHFDVFKKDLRKPVKLPLTLSKAHRIIYAQTDIMIEEAYSWPAWVSDIPAEKTKIRKGAPICTINAVAATTKAAKTLLQHRLATLTF